MPELVLALLVFYTSHSLLAARTVKRWAAERLRLVRWYRLMYSMISLALLAWAVMLLYRLPHDPLIHIPTWCSMFAWPLLFAGSVISAGSVMRFGTLGFFGLRQEGEMGLVRSGIHGMIRHPIYTGIVLSMLALLVLVPSIPILNTVAITFVYLPLGIHLEEQKLILDHGEGYLRYRREVPALFPRMGLSRRDQR